MDNKKRVIGLGFNGFPRGAKDQELPNLRPFKYPYILHSEINCIHNAHFTMEPEKCTMYITGQCCIECSKQIVQVGIGQVIYAGVKSACIQQDQESLRILNEIQEMGNTKFTMMPDVVKAELDVIKLLGKTKDYITSRW